MYPNLNKETFSINDINLCYKADSGSGKTLLRPTWFIKTIDSDIYYVPVKEEGGS